MRPDPRKRPCRRWRNCDSFVAIRGRPRNRIDPLPLRLGSSLACLAVGGEAMWPAAASQAGLGPSAGGVEVSLRYLHTMVRVTNIEQSLEFYCKKLGMEEVRRIDSEAGRYTNIFLAAP